MARFFVALWVSNFFSMPTIFSSQKCRFSIDSWCSMRLTLRGNWLDACFHCKISAKRMASDYGKNHTGWVDLVRKYYSNELHKHDWYVWNVAASTNSKSHHTYVYVRFTKLAATNGLSNTHLVCTTSCSLLFAHSPIRHLGSFILSFGISMHVERAQNGRCFVVVLAGFYFHWIHIHMAFPSNGIVFSQQIWKQFTEKCRKCPIHVHRTFVSENTLLWTNAFFSFRQNVLNICSFQYICMCSYTKCDCVREQRSLCDSWYRQLKVEVSFCKQFFEE